MPNLHWKNLEETNVRFGKIKTTMKSVIKILKYSFNSLPMRIQQIMHKLRHFIHTIRDLKFGDSSILQTP